MILDSLENVAQYIDLHEGFAKGFEFLNRSDLKDLPEGKYEIDGDRIFAVVAKEQGRSRGEAQLEVHNNYIDIQLVLDGTDTMGWRPRSSCRKVATHYDPQSDLLFYAEEPQSWLAVERGTFAIFFPEDAHLPLISSGVLHKVIVKVAVK